MAPSAGTSDDYIKPSMALLLGAFVLGDLVMPYQP